MSEEMIIRHCSPTLAGIKTGNMFTYPYRSVQEMRADIRSWNRLLSSKGLCVLPLKYNGRSALVYFYRPAMLSRDLKDKAASKILHGCVTARSRRDGASRSFQSVWRTAENFRMKWGCFSVIRRRTSKGL